MPKPLAETCLYTILRRDRLANAAKSGEPFPFDVGQRMVTARDLFNAAKNAEEAADFAVLFGDATHCRKLIYWARLKAIKVRGSKTRITVVAVHRLARARKTQELVLRSTGERIADGYIRPYAICRTPKFLAGKA